MTTSHTTLSTPTPAGRCLSCGEHVPFGAGALTGAGVVHADDRGCARAVRFAFEPFVVPGRRGPAWASAHIEPDTTPLGAPAGE